MNAQPFNAQTGARGPVCPSATAAAIWIITTQANVSGWDWEIVDKPAGNSVPDPDSVNHSKT